MPVAPESAGTITNGLTRLRHYVQKLFPRNSPSRGRQTFLRTPCSGDADLTLNSQAGGQLHDRCLLLGSLRDTYEMHSRPQDRPTWPLG